jgi:hypothetical protein
VLNSYQVLNSFQVLNSSPGAKLSTQLRNFLPCWETSYSGANFLPRYKLLSEYDVSHLNQLSNIGGVVVFRRRWWQWRRPRKSQTQETLTTVLQRRQTHAGLYIFLFSGRDFRPKQFFCAKFFFHFFTFVEQNFYVAFFRFWTSKSIFPFILTSEVFVFLSHQWLLVSR